MCTNTMLKALTFSFAFCSFVVCLFVSSLEAILSCKHKFSKGMSLRIEWKKIQSQGVSFVYYNGDFTGKIIQA